MNSRGIALVLALTLAGVSPRPAAAEPAMTLDETLREARRANAVLPVARLDAERTTAAVDEAKGRRLPSVAFDGDVHTGFPGRYASSDARAQLVAQVPLYDGGRLRAGVASSVAAADDARAGYHQAELDLDRQVRSLFAAVLAVEQELAFRRAGIERLLSYRSLVEVRRAGGQGVAADLSKTQLRLGQGEADVADAERRRDELKLELNELMGRTPDAELALAPLAPPETPIASSLAEPWLSAPEVAQADAAARAASANATAIRADRLPQISLLADAGAEPVWGRSKLALLNTGEGWGGELVLSVNLPLWDAGVYRSRLSQGALAEKAAVARVSVAKRGARLAWQRAVVGLRSLFQEVTARAHTVDTARDSYLQTESLYRGGVGTALDVLDAYDGWIAASQAHAEAVLRYRLADAELIRWGTP